MAYYDPYYLTEEESLNRNGGLIAPTKMQEPSPPSGPPRTRPVYQGQEGVDPMQAVLAVKGLEQMGGSMGSSSLGGAPVYAGADAALVSEGGTMMGGAQYAPVYDAAGTGAAAGATPVAGAGSAGFGAYALAPAAATYGIYEANQALGANTKDSLVSAAMPMLDVATLGLNRDGGGPLGKALDNKYTGFIEKGFNEVGDVVDDIFDWF